VPGTTEEELTKGELRTMDCVDCHNRPSHRFAQTRERAVDTALQLGGIPSNLPYIRREAVQALRASYPDHETAARGIKAHLEEFYQKNHPDLVRAGDGRIAQAVAGVQRVYVLNVFPKMNVTFGTHPNHIGHGDDGGGCFRCHDEEHKTKDGRAIGQDCELCHKMQ
jgi:hypothetical protein